MTKLSLIRKSLSVYNTTELVREVFFCAHTPESVVESCLSRLEEESFRALNLDMSILNRVRPQKVTTPLLVLAGAEVGWGPRVAHATARAYHTEAEFFPKMGHDMMLEPGWAAVAECIDSWLGTQPLYGR